MPTLAESGFRHGIATMPKLRVGMPTHYSRDIQYYASDG